MVALAPIAAAQTARETLQYLGATQIDAAAPPALPYDDLKISPHAESDADLVGTKRGPASASIPFLTSPQQISADTPDLNLAFDGLSHRDQRLAGTGVYANTQFSTEPPDQGLAVGNGFVLQTVNAALAIYDAKTGAQLRGPIAINQFFQLKPEVDRQRGIFGDFTSDPRAYYDNQLQRWFITVVAMATNPATGELRAPARLLIAVSQSSDPTQSWRVYSLDITNDGSSGCPCYGDQPLVGADAFGFFLSTNAFTLNQRFAGVQLYAISKQLLAQGAAPSVVHFNSPSLHGGFPFSVQPSHSPSFSDEPPNGVEYLVSVADIRNMLDNRVAVWAITNTASLAEATPSVKLRSTIVKTQPFGVPPDAVQKSGPQELGSLVGESQRFLATNDQRMQQAVFTQGRIWSALTTMVAVENEATPHAGIAYFGLTPLLRADGSLQATIFRQGYVAAKDSDLFYPALALNANGEGAIAFTLSGADRYPSAAFVSFDQHGPGNIQIAAAGADPQDGFSGYSYFGGEGSARTGDYSAATVDEQGSIWIASEYIPRAARTLLANWGTKIVEVSNKQ